MLRQKSLNGVKIFVKKHKINTARYKAAFNLRIKMS